MTRKIRLLSAVFVGAAILIVLPAVARMVHEQRVAPDEQRYDAYAVVGPDGKLIGAASSQNIRSLLQRDGLPE